MKFYAMYVNKINTKQLKNRGDTDFILALKNFWKLKKEKISIVQKNYRKPLYLFYRKRIYKKRAYKYIDRAWTTGYRTTLLKYRSQNPKLPPTRQNIKNANKAIKVYFYIKNSGLNVDTGDYANHLNHELLSLFKI